MADKILVKELMVPLESYATVPLGATIHQAVGVLRRAQDEFCRGSYPHRGVLVLDEAGRVVGKLSAFDIIRSLEPKYDRIEELESLSSHWGLSADMLRDMVPRHGLWNQTLENLCRAAARVKVEQVMYAPSPEEYVAEDDQLGQAMHQFVVCRHQSLLVTRDGEVVGILRLSDVFARVCEMILACRL